MDIVNGPFTTPRNSPRPYQTDDFPLFASADRSQYNAILSKLRQQYADALSGIKADVKERGASQAEYEFAVAQLREQYQNQLDAIAAEWQAATDRANQN